MKLEIISVQEDGVVKVATEGQITMADLPADHQKNPLADILGPEWATRRVALDLGRTGYVDSFAIGWLLQSHKQFSAQKGKLVIHSAAPAVLQVFELLKINRVLTLAKDESQAMQLLNGKSHGRKQRSRNAGPKQDGRGKRTARTGSSRRKTARK